MKKQELKDENLKSQLKERSKDRSYHFFLDNSNVRGVMVHGTRVIKEMRANHNLGILETLVLGQGYLAGLLMASNLKGNDRLSLQFECSGPIKGLVVDANAFGEVRGYLKQVPIPVYKPLESFDLSPFFGAGFLSVTKYLEDLKQPFTGKIMMENGRIAQDLALYYLKSEQIPTAFKLSVQFDSQGELTGAGGLFLQVMPNAGQSTVGALEKQMDKVPSLGKAFSEGIKPESIIHNVFSDFSPKILDNMRVEFFCRCSERSIEDIIKVLPEDEITDIVKKGPFPVEIRCHYCNTTYHFSKKEFISVVERFEKK